jgi:hypothetical protein
MMLDEVQSCLQTAFWVRFMEEDKFFLRTGTRGDLPVAV